MAFLRRLEEARRVSCRNVLEEGQLYERTLAELRKSLILEPKTNLRYFKEFDWFLEGREQELRELLCGRGMARREDIKVRHDPCVFAAFLKIRSRVEKELLRGLVLLEFF